MTRPDINGLSPEVAAYITWADEYVRQLRDIIASQEEIMRQYRETNEENTQQYREQIANLEQTNEALLAQLADIKQMLKNMQRLYFGPKSEHIRVPAMEDGQSEQLSIFGSEQDATSETENKENPTKEDKEATVDVSAHKRKKKRTQEEIIEKLPVIEHECDVPEEERFCPCCGKKMPFLGSEDTKEYFRVPEHIVCHVYHQKKYVCRECEEQRRKACESCDHSSDENCKSCPDRPRPEYKFAELPVELKYPLLKGTTYASRSIVLQVMYDKFVLAIPENRQEKEWARLGLPLSRQTMNNWILQVDKKYLQVLTAYMLACLIKECNVANCDETPVKVLNEKTENGNPKKCHMWVVRSGEWEPRKLVVFTYRASRAGDVPKDILSGYNKYFVSDGYSGYNELGKEAIRCGCWAHLRRKFYDAVPDHNMDRPGAAREGVRYCDRLFRIEDRLKKVPPDERLRCRQEESQPIVEEFYAWVERLQPAHKKLKDAVTYALKQKKPLMRFLEDGRIPLSNNAAENAIRPFVVGRKNWLFCKSNAGATAAADIYSIVETAKANGLDVWKYLEYLLHWLPIADGNLTDDFLSKLMPWNDAVQAKCRPI